MGWVIVWGLAVIIFLMGWDGKHPDPEDDEWGDD